MLAGRVFVIASRDRPEVNHKFGIHARFPAQSNLQFQRPIKFVIRKNTCPCRTSDHAAFPRILSLYRVAALRGNESQTHFRNNLRISLKHKTWSF